jgi:hypothetical protein
MRTRLNLEAAITAALLPLCTAFGQADWGSDVDKVMGRQGGSVEGGTSQGLLVTADDADVEIVVNSCSYGKRTMLGLELPVGKYVIEGRKKGYFTDCELEMVEEGSTDEVTLSVKRIRVQLSPSWGVLIDSGTVAGPLISLEAGMKTVRHYWGAFLVAAGGRNTRRENAKFCATGATQNFISFENRHVIVEAGVLAGYCWYRRSVGWAPDELQAYEGLIAGPRFSLHLGLDHFKLVLGAKHFIRLDEENRLFSLRNPTSVTAGAALAF